MNEIIFVIEEDPESGFTAKALNHSIFTQGETIHELKNNNNEAVHCHFEETDAPKIVRMHFVRDEVFALA
ncbi:MAG: hypothetical protein QG635_2011 [Bacteroidota bacterium]|nr:hypothetical protein [Bacteroidota bacterium]